MNSASPLLGQCQTLGIGPARVRYRSGSGRRGRGPGVFAEKDGGVWAPIPSEQGLDAARPYERFLRTAMPRPRGEGTDTHLVRPAEPGTERCISKSRTCRMASRAGFPLEPALGPAQGRTRVRERAGEVSRSIPVMLRLERPLHRHADIIGLVLA
jgi:hypothetical protein